MSTKDKKPVLIVIAGPNGSGKTSVTSKILHHEWMEDSRTYLYDNSIENAEAKILLRFSDGLIAKRYVEVLPEWAKQIVEY